MLKIVFVLSTFHWRNYSAPEEASDKNLRHAEQLISANGAHFPRAVRYKLFMLQRLFPRENIEKEMAVICCKSGIW